MLLDHMEVDKRELWWCGLESSKLAAEAWLYSSFQGHEVQICSCSGWSQRSSGDQQWWHWAGHRGLGDSFASREGGTCSASLKYNWAQDPPCAAALPGLLCLYTLIWAQPNGNKFLLLNWMCFLTEKRSIKRPKKGLFQRSARYQSVLLLAHPTRRAFWPTGSHLDYQTATIWKECFSNSGSEKENLHINISNNLNFILKLRR